MTRAYLSSGVLYSVGRLVVRSPHSFGFASSWSGRLPGLMKTPMVEHSAGLAQSYANGDVEAMWRARDAQVPMGRMGDAWDVAYAALFLASDEAKYVTGTEIIVDGGITAKYS